MPEEWLYYVSFIVQTSEGKIGLSAKPVNVDHRIDSPEIVGAVIEHLTVEFFPDGPPELPEGLLPIVPLTWQLITARQGPGVKGNGDKT